jgi:hypothetical protein
VSPTLRNVTDLLSEPQWRMHVVRAASSHYNHEQVLVSLQSVALKLSISRIQSIAHPGSPWSLETPSESAEYVLFPALPLPAHPSASTRQVVWVPVRPSPKIPPASPIADLQSSGSPAK